MPDLNTPIATVSRIVTLSDAAVRRIKKLRQIEGDPALMLRLTVSAGGCSGFQYKYDLDNQRHDGDVVFERDGAALITDEVSLDLIGGTVVDFVQTMMSEGFEVKNPNAVSSCGCGASFSL